MGWDGIGMGDTCKEAFLFILSMSRSTDPYNESCPSPSPVNASPRASPCFFAAAELLLVVDAPLFTDFLDVAGEGFGFRVIFVSLEKTQISASPTKQQGRIV